ncbi:MAG: glycosyltransferase [Phycisphaerae bacterium]|nr:glycosyltransferase [Phycisphaerae bacterium]
MRETLDTIVVQTFKDYEHVVVDGESTDNTIEIIEEYRNRGHNVRWISEPDRHADEGFYKAMMMSKGQYIMLSCISDGYQDKNWMQRCVDILDNDPEVSLVYGTPQRMSEDGKLGKLTCGRYLECSPPQKKDFFAYWLGTFTLCPENTFCVRADVFKKCFPKFEPTGDFLQNHALLAFNYNFNTNGYLPYYLPVIASYGRTHHDMLSISLVRLNREMKRQYKAATLKHKNDFLAGKHTHVFRDGNSNVVETVASEQLGRYRKRILHYYINRKAYLGKRGSKRVRYQLKKASILLADLFSR